jgi:hypothetical protein
MNRCFNDPIDVSVLGCKRSNEMKEVSERVGRWERNKLRLVSDRMGRCWRNAWFKVVS